MARSDYPSITPCKNTIPVIYLDACAMIELSRHEKGCCKDVHHQEIGQLYDELSLLMDKNKVYCALGNQLQEMGMSRGRKDAKNFLFRFTNLELRHPYLIEKAQLDLGYRAYVEQSTSIEIDFDMIPERDPCPQSRFIVHAAPVYNQEKLEKSKSMKLDTVAILNNLKENGRIEKDYNTQLETELKADFQVFLQVLEHWSDSLEAQSLYFDTLRIIYTRAGVPYDASNETRIRAVDNHNHFLLSRHHHNLPYKWIESVLWAHRMQRSNKIKQGDNLDTIWAAAYLPFVDYVVTDDDFCTLLHSSGLAEQYGTKVYSFKSLNDLLHELKGLK